MRHDDGAPLRVLVTGGGGMLGRALAARARHLPGVDARFATRRDADLSDRGATRALFEATEPDVVVHCAARVGGIGANAVDQSGFFLDNATLDGNVFTAALEHDVQGLLYLGSSCTYPRDFRQPLREDDLLQGPLEPTNEGYALAKLAGTRLCQHLSAERGVSYRCVVASNLYGPGDDFDTGTGHLVASALAKVAAARDAGESAVVIWGDGTARREFTYVHDLARWIMTMLPRLADLPPVLNVGAGVDHSVDEYYAVAARVVGYEGSFVHDTTRPTGMLRKLMDSGAARSFGWAPSTALEDGMRATHLDRLERVGRRPGSVSGSVSA